MRCSRGACGHLCGQDGGDADGDGVAPHKTTFWPRVERGDFLRSGTESVNFDTKTSDTLALRKSALELSCTVAHASSMAVRTFFSLPSNKNESTALCRFGFTACLRHRNGFPGCDTFQMQSRLDALRTASRIDEPVVIDIAGDGDRVEALTSSRSNAEHSAQFSSVQEEEHIEQLRAAADTMSAAATQVEQAAREAFIIAQLAQDEGLVDTKGSEGGDTGNDGPLQRLQDASKRVCVASISAQHVMELHQDATTRPVSEEVGVSERAALNLLTAELRRFLTARDAFVQYSSEAQNSMRERHKRQLKALRPSLTEKQLEDIVTDADGKGRDWLKIQTTAVQAITPQMTSQAKRVEARHLAILQVEDSMSELRSMFADMRLLINEQQEQLDDLQLNCRLTRDRVVQGEEHIEVAADHKAAYERARLATYCCVFLTVFLATAWVYSLVKPK